MELIFRGPDGDMACPLEPHDAHLLELSWALAKRNDSTPHFLVQLSCYVAEALCRAVDKQLQLPSGEEVAYAREIAAVLGVALPEDAMRYSGAMSTFLGKHRDEFARRRLLEMGRRVKEPERVRRKCKYRPR